MSFELNSPKPHRSTFHLSNLLQTLTKFRRNHHRSNNSFIRSSSTNSTDVEIKSTRRSSFNKTRPLTTTNPSINRPSSCFVLFSPTKKENSTCLFFEKPSNSTIFSPKSQGTSSFSKLKRVSSFLLPLKRKQSIAINHSLHERPFKAKENIKRRSRLLNSTTMKSKSLNSMEFGSFGFRVYRKMFDFIHRSSIIFDPISIDLVREIQLNCKIFNNYRSISCQDANFVWIELLKPFYGIFIEKQTLTFCRPKLFDGDVVEEYFHFVFLPFQTMKLDLNKSNKFGYDPLDPNTVQIPLHFISSDDLSIEKRTEKRIRLRYLCSLMLFSFAFLS